ncbi:hypothetical protein D1P53_001881 [Cryptococcus gattii VGV]|nr:hypothetical protein D1P53_001881 [Cryptococcus gattii VGV]
MLSRIQLAAALVEYDNDDDIQVSNPSQSPRNWRDSAIFLPFIQAQQEERRRKILAQPPPVLPGFSCQTTGTSNNNEELPEPNLDTGITEDLEENIVDNGDIDVGDWGLPSHLVSEPTPPRPEHLRRRAISQPLSTLSDQNSSKLLALDDLTEHGPQFGLRDDSGRRASLDQYKTRQAWTEPQSLDPALRRHTAMGLQDGVRPELRGGRISDPSMIPSPTTTLRPLNRNFATTSKQQLDTFGEREILNDSEPNLFTFPAPRPHSVSIFDPKSLEERRKPSFNSTNGFALDSRLHNSLVLSSAAGPERSSAPLKTVNSLTGSGQEYSEIPTPRQFGRPLMPPRYSTSAVTRINRRSLRPNVLVMPSPLADSEGSLHPDVKVPDGFVRGDKPLPAEAKTKGRRPGRPLSLSQKTFRSSLLVDGKRDYEEYFVGSSEIEGEMGVSSRDITIDAIQRRPGKLYGKSLIDELEARKAMMKGKQRVFTGDSRPAMMSRSTMFFEPSSMVPPSTDLIADPRYSTESRPSSFRSPEDQPLIRSDTIDDGQRMNPSDSNQRDTKGRSIFGVDHIWEMEMAKLKSMLDEGAGSGKIEAPLGNKEDKEIDTMVDFREMNGDTGYNAMARHQSNPPVMSAQESSSSLGTTTSLNSSMPGEEAQEGSVSAEPEAEEAESILQDKHSSPLSEEYSDEDVPLSKIALRSTASKEGSSTGNKAGYTPSTSPPLTDSEEDVPLSQLALRYSRPSSTKDEAVSEITAASRLQASPSTDNDGYDEDEDDLPLAVRQAQAKGLAPPSRAEIIEDELPLGYKHVEAVQRQMAQRHTVGGTWGGILNDVNHLGAGIGARNPYMMWGAPGHLTTLGLPPALMSSSTPSMPNFNVSESKEIFSSCASNIDNWRHEVRPPSERMRTGDDGRDTRVVKHMTS